MNRVAGNARLAIALALCCAVAISVAVLFPGYTTNANLLGMLLFAEIVLVALWNYRPMFFPFLVLVFFFAGTGVPPLGFWNAGRWFVLGAGALAGLVQYLRDQRFRLGGFHLAAFFCVVAALVSCSASVYRQHSLFKVFSFSLLFLYAASGMRVAVFGRERQFLSRLLLFCELLTYVTAACYFIFQYDFFGNPNSLGAVMGVLVLPMMLWGVFVTEGTSTQKREVFALVLSILLLATSYARAGILAAIVSCALICIALRRYRTLLMLVGTGLLAALAVVFAFPPAVNQPQSLTSAFIYKGHPEEGILGSRKSPWQQAVSSVHEHPWFGTGFGTSTTGTDASEGASDFTSTARDTREHGNSYLAILEWVGILGVSPFLALLFMIAMRVAKSLAQIRRSGLLLSPLVPIAAVVLAGLVHAAFEDWLFAVGYYLCVIFWGFAFVLADYVSPAQRGEISDLVWRSPHRIQPAA